MAIDVKNNRGAGIAPGQIKRNAATLQGQLKGQFGMIADQVSGMIIALGRGGGEQNKVRAAREAVAQIRQALETLFDVTVTDVRTMQMRRHVIVRGRTRGTTGRWKKAVVTLAEGQTLPVFEG